MPERIEVHHDDVIDKAEKKLSDYRTAVQIMHITGPAADSERTEAIEAVEKLNKNPTVADSVKKQIHDALEALRKEDEINTHQAA